jgi:hypothetical protein
MKLSFFMLCVGQEFAFDAFLFEKLDTANAQCVGYLAGFYRSKLNLEVGDKLGFSLWDEVETNVELK